MLSSYLQQFFGPLFLSRGSIFSFLVLHASIQAVFSFPPTRICEFITLEFLALTVVAFSLRMSMNFSIKFHRRRLSCIANLELSSREHLFLTNQW